MSAVRSVMQYTNDGMYVVEEKGVFSVCCEECNAIYQRWDVVVEEKGVCSVCCEECNAIYCRWDVCCRRERCV